MKKIFAIFCAAAMLFACTKEMNDASSFAEGGLKFKASIETPTKVATTQGKSAWEAGDDILLYSVAAGADAGVSLGGTLVYTTAAGGATAEFAPVGEATPSGDKYYAFHPAYDKYPSALKAADAIGFAAVAANDPVTDYRFVPVTVNTGITFEYDPTSGIAKSTNSYPVFYASADAPKEAGQAVDLTFKPVLPVIELGLKGYGTVASVVIAYADKTTDALDNASNKWLTGKGVMDLSTGVLTTTNTSTSGYCKLAATLTTKGGQAYVELNPDAPIYFQMPVGRFEVTKGLTLTITDKDGEVTTKTIWADRKVSGMSENGKCKFISQVINLGSAPVQNADYYEVPMSSIDWTKSYVHHVKDANDNTIAVVTKEFFGATVNKQGVVAYPAPSNAADYTAGKVMQVTLDGDAAPSGNVHGGSLSAWTTAAAEVAYTEGTSAAAETLYVKGDGSEISFEAPSAGAVTGKVEPYILTSTSGQEHPLVKIGERFWTACGYKTTKMVSAKDITITETAGALPSGTYSENWAHGLYIEGDKWLYNIVPLGFSKAANSTFTNKIAPEGWTLPSLTDWTTDLADYLGGTSSFLNMSKALLFSRTTFKIESGALKDLGYYNTWSCTSTGSSCKVQMLLCKAGAAPTKSGQSWNAMFELRLVSVK